jgi:ligand-binding sensor domain-containing protein
LWVGTWGGGLCKMLKNGSFKRFSPPVNNPETNNVNAFVSCLMYDANGLLFVGTEGGLAVMELDDETFIHLDAASNALTQVSEIGCLLKDSKGFVWAGTRNGLFRFSGTKLSQPFNAMDPFSQVQAFKAGSQTAGSNALPGGYITSLFEDNTGVLWAGTYGDGLVKCVPDGSGGLLFQQYSSRDGLCNNVVYAIQQDADGFLWLSTDNGLARFNTQSGHFDNLLYGRWFVGRPVLLVGILRGQTGDALFWWR